MRAQLLPVRFAVAVVLLFAGQLVLGQMLPAVPPAQVPPDVAHLAEAWLTPAEHGRLEHAGVRLDVPAGALLAPVRLTLAALDETAMPRLDPGLDNLTAPFPCLRLGPDGFKSQTAMTLTLPYDPARLPAGAVPEDVHTWFFDEQAERWVRLERLAVDPVAGTVTSRTDHFTDFVNAVLTQPDVPQGTNLAPSSIRGIDNADPAAGIVLIEPPQAGPNGDAELELPLVLPPGRHGIEPNLAVHYSSQRANGWLGLGWSLPVPSVTVDTAFGVPRYDPQLETETYLLDGAYLAPTANLVTPVPRRPDRLFTRRVEGSFERIVRKGSSPDAYWWEVTDQDGTRYVYGQSDQARLRDYQEPRNVFRWMLERIVDVHGNSADFTYFTDRGDDGESWVQIYPESIAYTAGEGQAPYYRVDFVRDTGDRPDAFSSGLPGFKTLTRFRLDHVDVRAGSALVRRYGFEYRDGDFSKSLLAAIAVSGEDPAAELYRHGFEYEQAERGAGGEVLAFADEVTWGGLSSSDDATHSTSVGAAVHAFVGLGPPGCFPHVGLQVGGGGGASLTSRLFLDVNGDGLPDRLNDDGGAELNRDGSFQPVDFPGASDLGRTIEFEFDLGVGAHAPPVNADASWVWSHANDDRTVADVDGDGWPDLVSTGGHFEVRRNLDGERFGSVERWEGFTFDGIDLTVPEEDDEVLDNFPLSDSLRELVLPYAGTVTLTGTIQKQAAGGIDGVDVWIYKNDDDTPLWTRRFAAGDLSPCQPAPNGGCGSGLTFDVAAGDHLFFLTGSIEDTTADALLWQPRVAYQGMPAAATEPYGAPVSVFDGGDDFRLAGPPAAHWVAVAEGEVRLLGALDKQPTADDVAVVVSRFAAPDPEGNPPLTGEVVFRRDFAAADSVTFDDFPSFAVGEAESLQLQIVSDNQVDPEQVSWTPQVTYGGGTLCLQQSDGGSVVCGPVECQEEPAGPLSCTWRGGPAPLPAEVLQAPAQPEVAVHHLEPASRPTVSWTAPAAGTFDFDLSWKGPKTTAAGQVLVYTQQLHELLDKRPVPAGAEELDFTLSLPLAAGEVVWFTSLADDQAAAGTLTVTLPQGEEQPTPVAANTRWLSDAGSVLSGGYHGWYFGEWNGDVDFSYPWDEDTEDLVAAVPQWQGLEDLPQPVWRAAGFDLHLAKQGDKPSRRGGNVVVELGVAARGAGAGPRLVHKTFGRTAGAGVDAVVGISLSTGTNVTQIDFVDVNGDRYPDQVAEGKVRYSNGTDGFGPLFDVPGFDDEPRRTEDGNLNQSIGLSLGIPYSKKGGKGKAKQTVNTMATAGRTRSLSQPRRDLRDVNGDGLPDLVSMVPNSREMKVRLNLGYRFGGEESWPLPAWTTRQLCDDFLPVPPNLLPPLAELNTPDALGLVNSTTDNAGIAIGPIGGGPSFTLSRNVVELADINGDGLADHLFRDQKGDFFRVKLNNGTGWDDETLWHEPDWQTALGGLPYDPLGLFQCLDAVSYNGVIGGSGSVAVPFCVPLVPPIVVAGLQIEVSVQAHGGTGGLQLFFEDVDGDGLPDHALKKTGQGSLHLKRNLTARVNLLRRVARPLGGSFTLDYARQGNRVDYSDPERLVDMPQTQWVLSRVAVDDGRGNRYETAYDYFDDAFWDRKERQEYGYARVRANLADGSTVDTWFHNQDFYRRNLAWKSEHRDAAGDLWVVESADHALREVAAQSFFPALERQQTTWYEGTTAEESGGISTAQTFDYDERGNVTLSETFLDQGPADDLRVTLGYTFDPTLYQVRTETLHAENLEGRTLRRRSATYTPLGDLATLTRYLTGGVDPASGQPYDDAEMVSRYTYRGDGNLETATDESGYTVTLTYDPETATHVTGVEDSFGYTTGHEYDLAYGLPTLTRDENDNELKRVYDGFGRLSQVFAPGDAAGDPTVSLTYAPDARPAYAVTEYDDVTRPGDPLRSALFVDGLERRIQEKQDTTYDDGGTFRDGFMVSGQLTYDVMGRVADQGQPTFSTTPLTTFVAAAPLRPTSFEYDVLDRVRKVAFPQRTATRVDYGIGELDGARRLLRTHVDPLGRTTRFYSNVAGSVIGVARQWTEDGRPTELLSRYDYNALQSPLSITDPAGHLTRLDYDTLGRRVVVDDPDAGRTEHRYSLAGNLGAEITSNLAAAGQQIGYRYTFHRLDAVDFPVSPDVAYTYGEPGADCNRANRVVTVSDESGVETRCYSALGQMIESSKLANTIGGRGPLGPYVTRWRYDDLDRLLALTYPDGETLTYGFDAGGRVTSAAGDADGTTTRYVERIGYDQFGTLVQLDYGNGVVHHRSYDPESRFLAGLSATGGSAGRFQNLLFTRDDAGSIEGLENDVAALNGPVKNGPVTQSFAYDDLYQLVGAEGTYQQPPNKSSVYTLGLDYDAIGNIERKNQLHTIQSGGGPPVEQMKTTYDWGYEYDGAQPAAPSHVGDRTFHYDGDGNQLGWDSDSTGQRRTVTWNERNRATSVADQGRTTRFLYDAAGQRTNKRGSLGETVYVNEWFSIRNGTIGSKQVFADRLRVATRIVQPPIEPPGDGGDGSGDEDPIEVKKLYYYHPDQLGSTHYVTDEDGELFRHLEYFPFGEGWVDESSVTQRTPYQWISKELDSQTGLYEFGFRFFQPRESQWLSADPILDQLLDTEALARPDLGVLPYRQPGLIYGYSANDPINLYDPTGLAKQNPQVAQRSAKVRRRIVRKVHAATAAGTGPLTQVVRGDVRKYARGIRRAQAIQKKVPLGKNVGFGFYNGKVKLLVSGNEPRSGILTPPVARRYNYVHSGFITRDNDTEAQYLEYLAAKLPAGAVGEVLIFTERPPCHSCRGVIQQFKADFPNMSLRVVSKVSDSAGKTEWNY